MGVDSNHRSLRRQIYSLLPLAAREPIHNEASSDHRRPGKWSWRWDSNPQPADYKSAALPIELRQRAGHSEVFAHSIRPRISVSAVGFRTDRCYYTSKNPKVNSEYRFLTIHFTGCAAPRTAPARAARGSETRGTSPDTGPAARMPRRLPRGARPRPPGVRGRHKP